MARSLAFQNFLSEFDCPVCGSSEPFYWHLDEPDTREIECGNEKCGMIFPVRNGVPIINAEAARKTTFNPKVVNRIKARQKAG